ncbi:unnamed protein product [Rhodiola kirilowii]
MESITKKPNAVVLVSPGMGHLTPILELVKRLVTHHDFEVTLFAVIADSSSIQSQILSSTSTIPNNKFLHTLVIQLDISAHVPRDTDLVVRILVTMDKAMPLVRSAIASMKVCPDLFIADLFGTDYWPMADEFNMSKYVFITTSAWFLALTVYLPVFEMEISGEELRGLDCIQIPGCTRVQKRDHIESFDRAGPGYLWFIGVAKKIINSDGIIVNSWHDLEPKAIGSLNHKHLLGQAINGQVYPVGPLVKQPSFRDKLSLAPPEMFKWMNKQPDQSVIYISFGSGGSLTYNQIQELASGLKFSQQRFIWVLRPPLNQNASEFFLSIDINHDHHSGVFDYLPAGFLDRTNDVGLVVPMWAPQAGILGHKSIGGFVTHCGWNSVIESVVNGVPMLAISMASLCRTGVECHNADRGLKDSGPAGRVGRRRRQIDWKRTGREGHKEDHG